MTGPSRFSTHDQTYILSLSLSQQYKRKSRYSTDSQNEEAVRAMRSYTYMTRPLLCALILFVLLPLSAAAGQFVLVLSKDDLKDGLSSSPDEDPSTGDSSEWDDFGDSNNKSEDELDPGSWRPIFEPDSTSGAASKSDDEILYYSGISKMISSVTSGDPRLMEEASSEIQAAAVGGFPHAQSALGFLYGTGQLREKNGAKAFLHHHFAAEGSNMQSKMALAYTYYRQDVYKP